MRGGRGRVRRMGKGEEKKGKGRRSKSKQGREER